MDNSLAYQKISNHLQTAEKILLVCHQQPDADALGSVSALSHWLNDLEKNHDKFCLNQPAGNLAWLLNFESVITDIDVLPENNYDTVIVLDSGDLKFAGLADYFAGLDNKPFVINIDHHPTNNGFGDINLIDTAAVSTTEIIYNLFRGLRFKIPPKVANALLAGIISDTYNFTNPNTSESSLEAAADLLTSGASLTRVSDLILRNKSLEMLQAWGEILIHLNYNPNFNSVSTVILKKEIDASLDVTEGVANFLNNLTGVKVVIILQQLPDNIVKGSLRTNDDLIDVSELAKMLGGGGHRKAAGFRLNGELVKSEAGQWTII